MFEQYAEYFWIALFAGLVFYGFWQSISAPFLVRRFYNKQGFTNQGKSSLDEPRYEPSVLLAALNAANVFTGIYKGHRVEQFAAFPETRYKFTLSRVQRKRNQALWTITILHTDRALIPFCARPTTVTDAIEYVLKRDNIAFPEDESFTNKVHVIADDHDAVRKAMVPTVRNYLNNIDPVSLESYSAMLVLKTPRQPHDAGNRLHSELDAIVGLYESLAT